jgi:uncharacterized RDD family membrane protein YckC
MRSTYAGLVTRGVAFMVDALIVNAITLSVTVGIGLVVSALDPGKSAIHLPEILLTVAGWLIFASCYLVGFWVLLGRTPGMRLMGIRVTSGAGERLTLTRALCRLVGIALSFVTLGLGFLLILVDDRRRALQDRLAGTVVVRAITPG